MTHIELQDTDAHEINEVLFRLRNQGRAASGQVLTLVIDTPADAHAAALTEARESGQSHPSRILVAIRGLQQEHGLNATIETASSATEVIELKLSGEVAEHASSVLLPLLLPELPVACWWPSQLPDDLGYCQMRRLTDRFIVDSTTAADPIATVHRLAAGHRPGTTDLAWTRLTRWRAMLVAALDQVRSPVRAAHVAAPVLSSPALLLSHWLEMRLGVKVERLDPMTNYAGLHAVQLITDAGPVILRRTSQTDGILALPGQPEREVALARRTSQQLLREELRQLFGDESYDSLMGYIAGRSGD